jgi:signal transduction histidine kinase
MHHRLDISIADAGIGIPRKVNEAFGVTLSPVAALRWALREGHTTKKGLPGGVGLKLLKDFIQINGGCVQIASGGAFWEFKAGKETFWPFAQPFPGTAVNLEVNTDDPRIYHLAVTGVQA